MAFQTWWNLFGVYPIAEVAKHRDSETNQKKNDMLLGIHNY